MIPSHYNASELEKDLIKVARRLYDLQGNVESCQKVAEFERETQFADGMKEVNFHLSEIIHPTKRFLCQLSRSSSSHLSLGSQLSPK